VDLLHLAELVHASHCQPQTDKKPTCVWTRWLTYLASFGQEDNPFLLQLDTSEQAATLKPIVIGGFPQAL
jgi:hypothetical protein